MGGILGAGLGVVLVSSIGEFVVGKIIRIESHKYKESVLIALTTVPVDYTNKKQFY